VVSGDSPCRTIGDLKGKRFAFRARGSGLVTLARKTLPDDVAYRIVRALHQGEARLCYSLPQACETTLANTIAASPRQDLIHPGVIRYMREMGMVK